MQAKARLVTLQGPAYQSMFSDELSPQDLLTRRLLTCFFLSSPHQIGRLINASHHPLTFSCRSSWAVQPALLLGKLYALFLDGSSFIGCYHTIVLILSPMIFSNAAFSLLVKIHSFVTFPHATSSDGLSFDLLSFLAFLSSNRQPRTYILAAGQYL